MGTQTIPQQYVHTCDACRKIETSDSKQRPSYWTVLRIEAAAYDYQGAVVADAGFSRLLCPDCTTKIHKAINDATVPKS